jgi:three-Cys-motif partner protein
MARAKRPLVPGDDGLPARDVGGWEDRKSYYVDRYAHLFAQGMKKKWDRRAYVELFAGPGRCWNRETGQFTDGSPIRSLSAPFTDYVFVDRDREAAAALNERARRLGHSPLVIQDDCNAAIDQVIAAIPPQALTLAFVDPTNWQVQFETVRKLATARRVDLLFTFMHGSMKRVEKSDPAALTTFFGTPAWKKRLGGASWEVLDGLASLYNEQLAPLGYQASYSRREIVKVGKNVPLYALILFSRHQRGVEFWEKTLSGPTEDGQQQMFGF